MAHIMCHSHASQCLLYINSVHRLYNITTLDQLPLPSQVVHSTQQVSWSSSSSTYIGIASTLAWVASVLPEEQWQIQGPRPVRNYFASGILASNAKTALHVTLRPDATNLLLNDIAMKYHLSDFEARYLEFLRLHSHDTQIHLTFNSIALWYKFRVQLHSTFHLAQLMPSQAIQAAPPLQDFLYGCCDAVLITPPNDGTKSSPIL